MTLHWDRQPGFHVIKRRGAKLVRRETTPAEVSRLRRAPGGDYSRNVRMPGQEQFGSAPQCFREGPLPGFGQPLEVAVKVVRQLDLSLDHAQSIHLHQKDVKKLAQKCAQ